MHFDPAPCRALTLVCFFAATLFPQAQSTSGDLRGTVVDASGGAVSGAKLSASDETRGLSRTAQSNPDGEFEFLALPPGTYRLRVEAPAFR